MRQLENKITFITGASSGIGRACAVDFAKEGSDLILCARRSKKLTEIKNELKKKFGTKVMTLELDIRNYRKVKKEITDLPDEWKEIDILINNAGMARGNDKIYEGKIENWEEMIETNVTGLLYVTKEVLSLMMRRGNGHIINIGSAAGHDVYPGGNVYCATKFAVNALSKSFRVDLLDKNIKVSSVDPGLVETEFSMVRFSGDEKRAKAVYEGLIPLSPADVSSAVLYCATRPDNVNINEIILTPKTQASSIVVHRNK